MEEGAVAEHSCKKRVYTYLVASNLRGHLLPCLSCGFPYEYVHIMVCSVLRTMTMLIMCFSSTNMSEACCSVLSVLLRTMTILMVELLFMQGNVALATYSGMCQYGDLV